MNYKYLILILFSSNTFSVFSQNCAPTIISEDGNIEYYGGKLKNGLGILTDDGSSYSFYVVQINKGKDGTLAFVSFFESVETRKEYNNAINDYLNETKLKNSYLEIEVNNEILRIPSSSCRLEPEKTLGQIYGYQVAFEGDILKSQVNLLQRFDIEKFKIVIGGKPYEKTFKTPTKKTKIIKEAISCLNLNNIFEAKKKKVEDLNLDEVKQSTYSREIVGKWLLQSGNGTTLEFIEGRIIVRKMKRIISNGTYKILGNRLIYTATANNGVSNFELFLKDMIVLKEKGKEFTYERIK